MSAIRAYLAVALGGTIGAIMRHLVSIAAECTVESAALGTFVANTTGAFLLGYLATLVVDKAEPSLNVRRLVTVGILGSYTTFSTLSYQTFEMIEGGNIPGALLNSTGSLVTGLAVVGFGVRLARHRHWRK